MMSRKFLIFLLNIVFIENTFCQIITAGGCGCQQFPVQQNLQMPIQVANTCGCRNSLLANLPGGLQIANSLLGKSLQCGCLPSNLQLGGMQGLQLANIGNTLQLANGAQLAGGNQISQDLMTLVNGMPVPNCQNALQLSLQALLNQLSQQPCPCGQQNLGTGIINSNMNLLGGNGVQKIINGAPCQQCGLQVLNGVPCPGQQELVLNNNPCQCQNVVTNPSPLPVSNPCPCQACQNIVSPCQSYQNPVQFTIYH